LDFFPSPFFDIGKVKIIPSAGKSLTESEIVTALTRHASCDFGEVIWEHHNGNLVNIEEAHGMLTSYYRNSAGEKFHVITSLDEFDPQTTIGMSQ
jgi:hypothetical protein